jgi:hypothetical protein
VDRPDASLLRFLLWGSIFLSFLVSGLPVSAQHATVELKADSVLTAKRGAICGSVLQLTNRSDKEASLRLHYQFPEGISSPMLSATPSGPSKKTQTILIPANERLFLPVKFQLSMGIPSGIHELLLEVVDSASAVVAKAPIRIHVSKTRQVLMQALSSSSLTTPQDNEVTIKVQLRNTGNTTENVRLITSLPGTTERRFVETKVLLQASHDTLLTLSYPKDKEINSLEQFTVNISGLYESSELFGSAGIQFQNASSERRFSDRSGSPHADPWTGSQNKISLISRNAFTDNMSWQLAANGRYGLGQGEIAFNTQTYLSAFEGARPLLSNTWIGYKKNRKGIVAGNITETLEKFIVGRGLKAYIRDTLRNQRFESGIIERSFNLLGDEYQPPGGAGMAAYVKADFGKTGPNAGNRFTTSLLFDRDVRDNSESLLMANSLDLIASKKKNTQLNLEFAPALVKRLATPAESAPTGVVPAAAAGLKLNTQLKKLTLNSTNYYSTSRYPGLRRGALQLNQRLGRRIGRLSTWGAFHLFESAPELFTINQSHRSYFLTSRSEIGVSFPLSTFLYLSITPKYEREKGRYQFANTGEELKDISAKNLSSTLSWRSRSARHNAFVAFETGTVTSPFNSSSAWHTRGNLSYNYQWLVLNATIQRGNFSLVETINNWVNGRNQARRLSISALARKDFFEKKLQGEFGLNYLKDTHSGENWTGNATTYYRISRKTTLMAGFQVYRYASSFFTNKPSMNFQTGIVQTLPAGRSVAGRQHTDLTLFYFLDANGNDVFDEGEQPASNFVVKVGPSIFITDHAGEINYRQLPSGSYTVSLSVQQGWYSRDRELAIHGKKYVQPIALKKTASLLGSIELNADLRLSRQFDKSLEGYTIRARDASGELYHTRTDEMGKFLLFLPEGHFVLSVDESEFPENVFADVTSQQLVIEAGKINEAIPFQLNIRKKKIEIKRFSAP